MRLRVSQAVDVRLGRQRSPEHEAGDHPIGYLRSANITDGALDLTDVKTMNFAPAEQAVFGLREGDVLVTEGSGSRDTVGASAVWRDNLPGTTCFQNTLLRLRPRAGVTDGRFVAWWARHAHSSGQFAAASTGANILHLGSDGIKRLQIDVPPLHEQRRIADFLDDQVARIDGAVLARHSQVQLAGDSWSSVVEEAISGDRVPTTRLGRVARVQSGLTVNARQQSGSGGSLVPYLSVSNVKDGYLDLSVVKEATATAEQVARHRLRHGDVLMTEGGDLDKLGRGTVWEDQVHTCLHQNHVFAVRPDVTRLDPWYLSYQTQAGRARRHFMLTASKSTNLASTSASKVLDLPVHIPPIVEQQAVASRLRELRGTLDENLVVLRRSISLLTEYRQSLITAAVSGELDVTTARKGTGS